MEIRIVSLCQKFNFQVSGELSSMEIESAEKHREEYEYVSGELSSMEIHSKMRYFTVWLRVSGELSSMEIGSV